MQKNQRRYRWFRGLDMLGLGGCVALILLTYSIFWYYTETIKGTFDAPVPEAGMMQSFE